MNTYISGKNFSSLSNYNLTGKNDFYNQYKERIHETLDETFWESVEKKLDELIPDIPMKRNNMTHMENPEIMRLKAVYKRRLSIGGVFDEK